MCACEQDVGRQREAEKERTRRRETTREQENERETDRQRGRERENSSWEIEACADEGEEEEHDVVRWVKRMRACARERENTQEREM